MAEETTLERLKILDDEARERELQSRDGGPLPTRYFELHPYSDELSLATIAYLDAARSELSSLFGDGASTLVDLEVISYSKANCGRLCDRCLVPADMDRDACLRYVSSHPEARVTGELPPSPLPTPTWNARSLLDAKYHGEFLTELPSPGIPSTSSHAAPQTAARQTEKHPTSIGNKVRSAPMTEAQQRYETERSLQEALSWCSGEFEEMDALSAQRERDARAALAKGATARELSVVAFIIVTLFLAFVAFSVAAATPIREYNEAEGSGSLVTFAEETAFLAERSDAFARAGLVALATLALGAGASVAAYMSVVNPKRKREARQAEHDRLLAESAAAAARCGELYRDYQGSCSARGELYAVSWQQFRHPIVERLLGVLHSGRAITVADCWAIIDRDEAVRAEAAEQERLRRRSAAAGVASFALGAAFGVMGAATSTKSR